MQTPTSLNFIIEKLIIQKTNQLLINYLFKESTVKPLNSGHLRVLTNLFVFERCPLLGSNLKNIVTFGTKCFVRYSWHVRH